VSVAAAKTETNGDEEEQAEGCHAHEIPSMLVDRGRDIFGYSGVGRVECNSRFGNQRLDDRAGGVIICKQLVYNISASCGPQEQLAWNLKRVPFRLLDPWFGSGDGIDGNREDMVAELEGAPRWDRDFGDGTDQGRESCAVDTFSTTCKSLGRVYCELAIGNLEDSFLGR
jgi:hypothetical protein